jgi:hypothetical protein
MKQVLEGQLFGGGPLPSTVEGKNLHLALGGRVELSLRALLMVAWVPFLISFTTFSLERDKWDFLPTWEGGGGSRDRPPLEASKQEDMEIERRSYFLE